MTKANGYTILADDPHCPPSEGRSFTVLDEHDYDHPQTVYAGASIDEACKIFTRRSGYVLTDRERHTLWTEARR